MNLAWHLLLGTHPPKRKPTEGEIRQAKKSIERLKGKREWHEVEYNLELSNAEKLMASIHEES